MSLFVIIHTVYTLCQLFGYCFSGCVSLRRPLTSVLWIFYPVSGLSPEESQEIARIMSGVNTYADEMMVKFILGTESLTGFDNHISTFRRMI